MSGDVQPRKRKDKKRKKDDLGVNEPRGTSAALGEGDSFMHSHHDHGTGGHWCAKVIFFSLLAILVALIGLIILENRGLSELEANAVQSQYSGVLEGWLEDAPEDDHHDTHTLELNHHDDEDDAEHGEELEHSDEVEGDDHDDDDEDHDDDDETHDDEADDDDGSPEDEENSQDDEDEAQDGDDDEESQENEDGSQEQDLEANNEDEELPYKKYYHGNEADPDDDDDDDDDDEEDENEIAENNDDEDDEDENETAENNDDDDEEENEKLSNEANQDNDDDDDQNNNQSLENDDQENEGDDDDEGNDPNNEAESEENNNKDEEEHDEGEDEDTSLEVEKIEQEASEEEEPISAELPTLPEPADDDDDDNKPQDSVEDEAPEADDDDETNEPDDDFLEVDDDEPAVERITAPAGKPFAEEEEEETSSEKPADTLAEEEEYEKRQEELRREEAQASHMWLKLTVGGALLVATHAIVRRATASSDEPTEQRVRREETPIDRRMTLIPEEPTESVPIKKVTQESTQHIPSIVKSPPTFEESEEEVEEEEEQEQQEEPVVSKVAQAAHSAKQEDKQELYSDEEDAEDDEVEEEKVVEQKAVPQVAKPPTPEPDDDVPDDVEIIEDEEIEEEAEEDEEDEEEISDVDDEELLTRLEAKYGRLPEPERPQRRKDGGNSIEDEWPGEPSDAYWRSQLDQAEQEFNQGAWLAAAERAGAAPLRASARARRVVARALDAAAEHKRDNALLGRAITAYLELLKMNERLSDKKLLEIAERTINRIQFRGTYLNAEPVYRLLIRRFPDDPFHRTNLTVMFLMANRADLAENVLKETLQRWPDDRLSLAQYGFVLKTRHNRLEEAADFLQRALEGDTGPATEPRYYYHLGDTLLLLGRFEEAHEVHKRAAAHGHFLSPAQRSLYNVPRLKGQPWWNIEDTPYVKLARALEKSWRAILREGEAAKALYEQEKEGLKERGEWSQLDLFARGQEIPGRCDRAPVTCATVRAEAAAAGCRRGQVKFSAMRAGTHVRPHVGPTNCRLRMHLGLSNTKDTFIRVDQETRQWKEGKVLIFDDSFEHEVWHNGTGSRLVLIVDVWHPELTAAERRQLPAI